MGAHMLGSFRLLFQLVFVLKYFETTFQLHIKAHLFIAP